jgi:hypothetical protein
LELKAITGATGHPYCYAYKDVPATEGQAWEAEIYAKLTEVPGGGRASAQFKLAFFNAKGDKLRTYESAKLTKLGSDYERLSTRGTAPKGTATVRMTAVVSLQGESGTVAAYFDDARLSSGATVFESGFESGAVR